MRFFAIISTFLLTMFPLNAYLMDAVFGSVVSIDREGGKMVVAPFSLPGAPPRDVNAPGEMPATITVLFPRVRLPDCIRTDGPVRLWGEFFSNAPATFKASYIRGMGKGHTHDPTGVRGRFGRGRGKAWGGRHGHGHDERDGGTR